MNFKKKSNYELELFEMELLEEFKNDNNGILYWKSLSNQFPILSRIVRDYFSIQPSSITCEKVFSRVDLQLLITEQISMKKQLLL